MRKVLLWISVLIASSLFAQQGFDLKKYVAFKFYTNGINDEKTADYVARTLEKSQLSTFSAFNYKENIGYSIVTDAYYAHEIEKYINNMMNVRVESYEIVELTEDLFLDIYLIKGNALSSKSKQLPPFISMGPYTQLSNDLYALAKSIWIKKYPDVYNSFFHSSPLTPEQIEEQNRKLNRKN
ncbi:MAG: hypothetical protein HPY79_03060 [Bacteroidales bacterium]|nr:hypothetical protein [Bacteroidales bacterium]